MFTNKLWCRSNHVQNPSHAVVLFLGTALRCPSVTIVLKATKCHEVSFPSTPAVLQRCSLTCGNPLFWCSLSHAVYLSFPFSSEKGSIVYAASPPAPPKPVVQDAGYLKAVVHVLSYLFAWLKRFLTQKELERIGMKIVYVR